MNDACDFKCYVVWFVKTMNCKHAINIGGIICYGDLEVGHDGQFNERDRSQNLG